MTQSSISAVLEQLYALQDEKYRQFNESLLPGWEGSSIGVRLPQLRAIAKSICKDDWRQFIGEASGSQIYEVVMLRGLVIAGAPCDYAEQMALLAGFIPEMNNWGVCDSVASSLKSVKQHLPETFSFLQDYLQSEKEFEARFAVVMLLDHFILPEYIDVVLERLSQINRFPRAS